MSREIIKFNSKITAVLKYCKMYSLVFILHFGYELSNIIKDSYSVKKTCHLRHFLLRR